jgi:dihydrofolate reductase
MKLSLIAAVANNNVIGNENKLMWRMPEDLKHFKKTTMGHSIIMGRKTWESIRKPLKGRQNIVLTRKEFYLADGCEVVHSIDEAIKKIKHEKEVFVIGGSDIYEQCIDLFYTRRLYITRIFASFDGDAFFPDIDTEKWELEDMEEHDADEKNKYPYAFLTYKKKKSALCK